MAKAEITVKMTETQEYKHLFLFALELFGADYFDPPETMHAAFKKDFEEFKKENPFPDELEGNDGV